MSKHDPRVTLHQLRDAARLAEEMCLAHPPEVIMADWVKRYALERCFEVVGEAIKRLPAALRMKYGQHNWTGAAGARDRIAHGYEWVDHHILWEAVRDDFPILFATVDQMLADLGGELPAEEMPG